VGIAVAMQQAELKETFMIRRNWIHTALAVALAFVAVPAVAQPAAPAPAVDAASVAALNSMSAYLRTLKTFQVEAATTTDEVLDDGQLVKYSGTTNIVAQFPNKLLADVSSDRNERQYVYDGKTFTLLARRVGYYATVPAPATVRELADVLSAKYDIEVPLSDLFLWGAPGWNSASITSALDLGPGEVGGTTCQHYAFRQEGVDWQIWIQKGDFPLPRKLVITTLTDPARPQHSATYTWNLAPSVNDAAFTFTPPKGASKIVLADVSK
jgi:hypothetical protein